MPEFIHLHNHTHYSLLDAISSVDGLVNAAVENNMPAVAITDHGVMYGVMEFYKKCVKAGIKPVIGFEAYVAQASSRFEKGKKSSRGYEEFEEEAGTENTDGLSVANINYAHLVLLAKNETGYKNLIMLNSIGHTEGFYYKPRIDLEVLNKYREGLVALSACAGGVISAFIVRNNLEKANQTAGVYKDIFGEDFYLELQNHLTLDSEKAVLKHTPEIARKHNIKLIATNDVHYIKKEHAIAHNIYLHISAKQNKNIDYNSITDTNSLRYGTDQIYFKSTAEMCKLFKEFPDALKSTLEVTEKCNLILDTSKNFMPEFPVPAEIKLTTEEAAECKSEDKVKAKLLDKYLEKLSREGLEIRFEKVTDEEIQRLEVRQDMAFRVLSA